MLFNTCWEQGNVLTSLGFDHTLSIWLTFKVQWQVHFSPLVSWWWLWVSCMLFHVFKIKLSLSCLLIFSITFMLGRTVLTLTTSTSRHATVPFVTFGGLSGIYYCLCFSSHHLFFSCVSPIFHLMFHSRVHLCLRVLVCYPMCATWLKVWIAVPLKTHYTKAWYRGT